MNSLSPGDRMSPFVHGQRKSRFWGVCGPGLALRDSGFSAHWIHRIRPLVVVQTELSPANHFPGSSTPYSGVLYDFSGSIMV